MIYRNPIIQKKALRLGLMLLTALLWGITLNANGWFLLSIIFLVLLGIQFHYFLEANFNGEQSINQFLTGLKSQRDQSEWIKTIEDADLKNKFLAIEEAIKDRQKSQEAEYQYFRNIVQHVGIGIITFDATGAIQLYNFAAKKLLNTAYTVKNIEAFSGLSIELLDTFKTLKTGGRRLVEVKVGEEIRQLSVYAIELQLRSKQFKLISLQNIQSELDEKEMEAWRNLIRVLTHEIMNSVTPISSLSNTTHGLLEDLKKNENEQVVVAADEIDDLKHSISTIEKRSEGLIRFLNEFRSLTHTPNPKLRSEDFNLILRGIAQLMQDELNQQGVKLQLNLNDDIPMAAIDRELIEQVIINLIKNAAESFEDDATLKNIWVSSNVDAKKRVTIVIKDNGNGIEPEALTKIFIPFFTTKKTGSGIGLSLSKEIIRKHQGTISVQSQLGEGTEFSLKF